MEGLKQAARLGVINDPLSGGGGGGKKKKKTPPPPKRGFPAPFLPFLGGRGLLEGWAAYLTLSIPWK